MFGMGIYILAWVVFWNFLIRVTSAHYSNSPASQAIAQLL